MIEHKTKKQIEEEKRPSPLDFYTVAYRRNLIKSYKEKSIYSRLIAGIEGEEIVADYLKKYGKDHWVIIRNLWQDFMGTFESDLILFTSNHCYVFEIKNYNGIFNYQDGICKLNDKQISTNCVHQARRAKNNLERMCEQLSNTVPIIGIVAFTGIDNIIQIDSKIDDLSIIPRSYLANFIEVIAKEEIINNNNSIETETIINHFENYEINNPFISRTIEDLNIEGAERGIYCENCFSYDIQISKMYIHCNCGQKEYRERAAVRTICDYGVLNYDKNLTRNELLYFFNTQIKANYLSKILYKHFPVIAKQRYTYFGNPEQPFSRISGHFTF